MCSSITTSFAPVSDIFTTKKVYQIVGGNPGDKLPSHTSIDCYPIVYLTKYGYVRCAECATSNDDSFDCTIDAGILWEGEAHTCDDCQCEIESAYG